MGGRAKLFALEPGLDSNRYSPHLQDALGMKTFETPDYDLTVPTYDCSKGRRIDATLQVKPIWEVLEDEVQKSNETFDILARGEDLSDDPSIFQNNPVVAKLSAEERKKVIQTAISKGGSLSHRTSMLGCLVCGAGLF